MIAFMVNMKADFDGDMAGCEEFAGYKELMTKSMMFHGELLTNKTKTLDPNTLSKDSKEMLTLFFFDYMMRSNHLPIAGGLDISFLDRDPQIKGWIEALVDRHQENWQKYVDGWECVKVCYEIKKDVFHDEDEDPPPPPPPPKDKPQSCKGKTEKELKKSIEKEIKGTKKEKKDKMEVFFEDLMMDNHSAKIDPEKDSNMKIIYKDSDLTKYTNMKLRKIVEHKR